MRFQQVTRKKVSGTYFVRRIIERELVESRRYPETAPAVNGHVWAAGLPAIAGGAGNRPDQPVELVGGGSRWPIPGSD
jgi:hypothetical protein